MATSIPEVSNPGITSTSIKKKRPYIASIREPKVESEASTHFGDYFFIKGWYVANEEQILRVTFDGTPQIIRDLEIWEDVETVYSEYPVRKAFKVVVPRSDLQKFTYVKAAVGENVFWEIAIEFEV